MNIIFGVCVCARARARTLSRFPGTGAVLTADMFDPSISAFAQQAVLRERIGNEEESLPSSQNLGSNDEQDSMPEEDIDVTEGAAMGLSPEQQRMMEKWREGKQNSL